MSSGHRPPFVPCLLSDSLRSRVPQKSSTATPSSVTSCPPALGFPVSVVPALEAGRGVDVA